MIKAASMFQPSQGTVNCMPMYAWIFLAVIVTMTPLAMAFAWELVRGSERKARRRVQEAIEQLAAGGQSGTERSSSTASRICDLQERQIELTEICLKNQQAILEMLRRLTDPAKGSQNIREG
jgi:hypothetical protein